MHTKVEPPLLNESADRALRLIVLLRESGTLSVKEAAENLGIAPSTAHRLLATLVYRDFAQQMSDRKYGPGREILAGGPEPMSVARLREIARPSMTSVVQSLKETVQLVVLRGGNIEFVDGVEGENLLRVGCRFGVQIPAFTSAAGKALLAEMSDAQLESLYSEGIPNWPTSSIRTTSELIAELRETRRDGFGTNFEESEQGIAAVGTVIRDPHGVVRGALAAAIPASHFHSSDIPHIVSVLHEATTQIGKHCGQVPSQPATRAS